MKENHKDRQYLKKSIHSELVNVIENIDKTKDQMDKCAAAMIKCGKMSGINELVVNGSDMRSVSASLNGWIIAVGKVIDKNLASMKNDKESLN